MLDSKCDYPAACNAMETLLIHKSHLGTQLFDRLWDALKAAKVLLELGHKKAGLRELRPGLTQISLCIYIIWLEA